MPIRLAGIDRLLRRPDFREKPVRAVWRRIAWRTRWMATSRPWIINLDEGLKISVPRLGPSALIYYQGCTEPETRAFLKRFLQPGMVVADVGAHVGEYVLIAATAIGPCGEVHAFEANPGLIGMLRANVRLNGLSNVVVNACAVAETDGHRIFRVESDPALSSLDTSESVTAPPGTMRVPAVRLDSYWRRLLRSPNLIKIDVEGAELLVLQGAADLLAATGERSPVVVFEMAPDNYRRFGYDQRAIRDFLASYGYTIQDLSQDGSLVGSRPDDRAPRNLVAWKAAPVVR